MMGVPDVFIPPIGRALLPPSALQSTAQLNEGSLMATIDGVGIPDSKLCREITELVRDFESDLLFNHSSRVYYFGALTGQRRGVHVDRELLYAGAMFHDMGLVPEYSSRTERFEVDGANA